MYFHNKNQSLTGTFEHFYLLKLSDVSGLHRVCYDNKETLDPDIKYELMMMAF